MYKHKAKHAVQRIHRRATRTADRYKFQVERYNSVKYKNSPYNKGSELWDALPQNTIDSEGLFEFKKRLKCQYVVYKNT